MQFDNIEGRSFYELIILEREYALIGLALPRASHSSKIALSGLRRLRPTCRSTTPFQARTCHSIKIHVILAALTSSIRNPMHSTYREKKEEEGLSSPFLSTSGGLYASWLKP